jgi:hypothetical protein
MCGAAMHVVCQPRIIAQIFILMLMPNHELLEVHRSKISLHRAKADYSYPTISLPHTFSALAGLPTRIYQTVHDGALAFLVVVSPGCTLAANRSEKISQNFQ